jgi:hypothetical protein
MYIDYPTEVLVDAVRDALAYDLCDLGRIEHMVLGRITGDYFRFGDHDDFVPDDQQLELDLDARADGASDDAPNGDALDTDHTDAADTDAVDTDAVDDELDTEITCIDEPNDDPQPKDDDNG